MWSAVRILWCSSISDRGSLLFWRLSLRLKGAFHQWYCLFSRQKHQGKLCESGRERRESGHFNPLTFGLAFNKHKRVYVTAKSGEEVSKCHLECNHFCIHDSSQVTHRPLRQTAQRLQVYEVSVWANCKTCRAINILSCLIQSRISELLTEIFAPQQGRGVCVTKRSLEWLWIILFNWDQGAGAKKKKKKAFIFQQQNKLIHSCQKELPCLVWIYCWMSAFQIWLWPFDSES